MRAIVISDVHIHSSTMDLVGKLIDILLKEKIDNLFILGDWFHKPTNNSIDILTYSKDIFEKLASKFNIFMLAGNHDVTKRQLNKRQSPLSLYSHYFKLYALNEPKYFDGCYFIPYTSRQEQWDEWYKNKPKNTKIIFAHQAFVETNLTHMFTWLPFKQQCNSTFPFASIIQLHQNDIPIISGHIHVPMNLCNFMYTGSPYPIKINEGDEHYYYILDTDNFKLIPKQLNLVNYVRVSELKNEYNKPNYIVYANINKSDSEIRAFYNNVRKLVIQKVSSVILAEDVLNIATAKSVIENYIDNSEYKDGIKQKVKKLIFGG